MISLYCDGRYASIGTAPSHAGCAVLLRDFQVEPRTRDAQYKPARTPVGTVEEGIEVFCDELVWVRLEIAPLIRVHEPCRVDRGPAGDPAEPLSLQRGERAVDGDELVVLELAHGAQTP
jgi:hypothetical protein